MHARNHGERAALSDKKCIHMYDVFGSIQSAEWRRGQWCPRVQYRFGKHSHRNFKRLTSPERFLLRTAGSKSRFCRIAFQRKIAHCRRAEYRIGGQDGPQNWRWKKKWTHSGLWPRRWPETEIWNAQWHRMRACGRDSAAQTSRRSWKQLFLWASSAPNWYTKQA